MLHNGTRNTAAQSREAKMNHQRCLPIIAVDLTTTKHALSGSVSPGASDAMQAPPAIANPGSK
jgi:hypothetical protein